ncbi:MAG: hypothetical protein QOG90_2278 [Actinomycetota bacterium]
MPAQALMLAFVIIAGACAGVIVGRLLTAAKPTEEEVVAPPVELTVVRELDDVLAPYQPKAA